MTSKTKPTGGIWTLAGTLVREIPGLDGGKSVSWSPDSRWIAAGNTGITFFHAETGQSSPLIPFPQNGPGSYNFYVPFHTWSPDSKFIAIANTANTIGVIDVERREVSWFAVLLPDGETAIYDGAGRPLFTPPAAEDELCYVVEPKPDTFELLTPKEFTGRFKTESRPTSVEP